MSKRKSALDIHGLILLDKRLGVSSNHAMQEVRRLLNANKAGHTGSLDPLASGLLPLCFGEATKVSALLLHDDKRYAVTVQLGVVTNTGDAEGDVIATKPVPHFTDTEINQCLQHFTGIIHQTPPMYSAVKHNGIRLYALARAGKHVERPTRQITIYALKLTHRDENYLHLDVLCSKGTYIRSLAEDIGEYLGCGGTVTALRRTQAGQFDLKDAWTIEQLQALSPEALLNQLMPIDAPLAFLPAVHLSAGQSQKIQFGQQIRYTEAPLAQGHVRLYHDQHFLGLGEMHNDGKLAPKRMLGVVQSCTSPP